MIKYSTPFQPVFNCIASSTQKRKTRNFLSSLVALSWISFGSVCAQPLWIPEGQDVKSFSEIIDEMMAPYQSALQTMSESDLAAQSKEFKHVIKWRDHYQQRIHPDGSLIDYFKMKEDYLDNQKANTDGIGDWYELGPYAQPGGEILDIIGGGELGIGPVNWITFDPNFSTTQLMFTGGWSTGLWYSENGGDTWLNGGTDQLIARVSTADCKSSHLDSDVWFLATGDGDGNNWDERVQQRSSGLFCSVDRGANWELIGSDLDLGGKLQGGGGVWNYPEWQLKHILLDPTSTVSNLTLFSTGTFGIYKTENAMASVTNGNTQGLEWERILDQNDIPNTVTRNGVEYTLDGAQYNNSYIWAYDITWGYDVQGNIDVTKLIASCRARYVAPDLDPVYVPYILVSQDKGDTWEIIPHANLSPEFLDLYKPVIRTVETSPNILYIHSIYFSNLNNNGDPVYNGRIIRYNLLTETSDLNIDMVTNRPYGHEHQTGFAVNPKNVNEGYMSRGIDMQKCTNFNSGIFQLIDASGKFHVDVEDVEYSPDGSKLWLATHGGPFVLNLNTNTWAQKMDGIGNAEVNGFSTSPTNPSNIFIGAFHDGSIYATGDFGPGWVPQWKTVLNGDGQETLIDRDNHLISYGSMQSNAFVKNSNGWTSSSASGIDPPGGEYLFSTNIECNPFDPKEIFVCKTEINRHSNRGDASISPWVVISDRTTLTLPNNNDGLANEAIGAFSQSFPSEVSPNLIFAMVYNQFLNSQNNLVINTRRGFFGCNKAMGTSQEAISSWFRIPYPPNSIEEIVRAVVSDPDNVDIFYFVMSNAPLNGNIMLINKVLKYTFIPGNLMGTPASSIDPENDFLIEDLTYDFPNLAAQNMIIIPGSREFLIATDVGVFYSNESLMQGYPNNEVWLQYGTKFPYSEINRMEVGYDYNKVRVGTWGRGVWENDLPCTKLANELVINTNTTWSGTKRYRQDIRIDAGATLTITGKVYMATGCGIKIEPNARLIVDGGTITGACDEMWAGIEVWGDTDQHQFPYSGGQYHQGRAVFRNGALIENAWQGVMNWNPADWDARGGIIQATNSTFKNNRIDAIFMAYQNYSTSSNVVKLPERSYFQSCNFILDDDYLDDPNDFPPRPRITIWRIDRMRLQGCNFTNTQTVDASEKRGHAIFSHDASYLITEICQSTTYPCPVENNVASRFTGWHKAIEALETVSSRPIQVRNSIFDENMIGVELGGADYSQIYLNIFNVGGHPYDYEFEPIVEDQNHLGIFANETYHYSIEENTLTRPTQGAPYEGHGVLVFNSQGAENQVYKNTLSNLKTGINGWQVNLNINLEGGATFGQSGLQFLCNNNNQNEVDFEMSRTGITGDPVFDNSGIRLLQGSANPPRSASNTFSSADPDPLVFTHFTVGSNHPYFYFTNGNLPQATEIGPGNMTVESSTASNNCPSNYTTGPQTGLTGLTELLQSKAEYEGILYAYNQLIDDGNTPATITEIELTWPQDAWDLRDQLMLRAPYNSEAVLIAAIDRNIMPHAMLLEVLQANPDALRSGNVIRRAETIPSPPMPAYMIDLLWASLNQTTLRTAMESTIADLHAEVQHIQKIILTQKAFADSTYIAPDSTIYYLGKVKTVEGNYSRASALAERHLYADAILLLDSMQTNYTLSTERNAEMTALKNLYSLLSSAHGSGLTIANLSPSEISGLQSIAESTTAGIAAKKAQNALCFHYQICYDTEGQPKNLSVPRKPQASYEELKAELNKVNAYPNPGDAYVTIAYTLFQVRENTQLLVFDGLGRQVENRNLGKVYEGQQLIDARKLANGVYIFQLVQDGKKVSDGKFVVTH